MEENGVEVIVFNGIYWLNEKHVEEQLGHANLVAITRRYNPEYRKHRYELADNTKNNQTEYFYMEESNRKDKRL